jgi:hypothetical protein
MVYKVFDAADDDLDIARHRHLDDRFPKEVAGDMIVNHDNRG